MKKKLLQKLVMDKTRVYVTLNILLTVGNSTNMSGLAAVNHDYQLLQRLVPSATLGWMKLSCLPATAFGADALECIIGFKRWVLLS